MSDIDDFETDDSDLSADDLCDEDDCGNCGGSGEVQWMEDDLLHIAKCPGCHGTGVES